MTGRRLGDLAALGHLRDELRRRQREAAERAAAEQAEQARREREAMLFERSVGPVQPLRAHGRVEPELPRLVAWPRQREADEREALRATMSDGVDALTLLETDDALSFRRPHVGPEVLRKLRRGVWVIQAQLDLHGLHREAARDRLAEFLHEAQAQGLRCVRVVHGKGHGSPGRRPVLKGRVQRWLTQRQEVLAYVQARASEGGAGAVVVMLDALVSHPVRRLEE